MNKKGFLLFEIMMSIVIITVALLFITRSYSASKTSIKRSAEIFRTSLLLESRMWEYEEEGQILAEKDDGDFEEAEEYAWEIEAESLDEEEGFGTSKFKLNTVRLSVFKEKDRKRTEYSIWTYLRDKFI